MKVNTDQLRSVNRRNIMKQVSPAALLASAALVSEKKAAAAVTVTQASWVHGSSAQIESPGVTVNRYGWGIQIYGSTWVHIAVPTPVLVSDKRLSITKVGIIYSNGSLTKQASVLNLHVYDGTQRIQAFDDILLTPGFQSLSLTPHLMQFGVGVSLYVVPTASVGAFVLLQSVGADFL